jgi:type IV pilus assembly protein PilF
MKRLGSIGVLLTALSWSGLSLAGAPWWAGCASPASQPGPTASNRADRKVTESDEPENRRRARIRMELAVGYFEQGKTSIALDELKQVIANDPTRYPEAYNLRGLIYMRLNDMRLAEDSFRRAVVLNPRDANTLHNLGWLLCQQNRYGEARAQFDLALASPLYGDRAKTLMAQGLCQRKAGKRRRRRAQPGQGLRARRRQPIVGYNLANLLYAAQDLSRAQFYIRRLNNSDLGQRRIALAGHEGRTQAQQPRGRRAVGRPTSTTFPPVAGGISVRAREFQ